MKEILAAVTLAVSFTAAAQTASAPQEQGHQARLYERYCDKLREGPEAYGQFVNRMRLVTGLTATDFASHDGSEPGVASCREKARKLALAAEAREKAKR